MIKVTGVSAEAILLIKRNLKFNFAAVPAVYHDTIRPRLVQQMDLMGSYGRSSPNFCNYL